MLENYITYTYQKETFESIFSYAVARGSKLILLPSGKILDPEIKPQFTPTILQDHINKTQ